VVSTACTCSLHNTPQSVLHRQLQLPHHRTVFHAFTTGGPHMPQEKHQHTSKSNKLPVMSTSKLAPSASFSAQAVYKVAPWDRQPHGRYIRIMDRCHLQGLPVASQPYMHCGCQPQQCLPAVGVYKCAKLPPYALYPNTCGHRVAAPQYPALHNTLEFSGLPADSKPGCMAVRSSKRHQGTCLCESHGAH